MPNQVGHSISVLPQERFAAILEVFESLPVMQELGLQDFNVSGNRIKFWTAWRHIDTDKLREALGALMENIHMEIAWENMNMNEYGYLILINGNLTIVYNEMSGSDMDINDDEFESVEPAGKFREFLDKNELL
jgi:hypothetical protein